MMPSVSLGEIKNIETYSVKMINAHLPELGEGHISDNLEGGEEASHAAI